MAVTMVNEAVKTASAHWESMTIPSTTAGNALICVIVARGTTQVPTTDYVQLGGSSTNWSFVAGGQDSINKLRYSIWKCTSCAGGQTSVSWYAVNTPGGGYSKVYEFSGHDSAGTFSSSFAYNYEGTTANSGNISTSVGQGLAGFAYNSNGATPTGPGSPWSNQTLDGESPSITGCIVGYAIETAATNRGFDVSYSADGPWGAGVVGVPVEPPEEKSSSDTGTGTDAESLSVSASETETSSGADTGAQEASLSDADTGDGIDAATVADAEVDDAETSSTTETDFVGTDKSDSDTATAVDVESDRGLADDDLSVGVDDAAVLAALVTDDESAVGTDGLGDQGRTAVETATAVDTGNPLVSVSGTETVGAVEAGYLNLIGSDSAHGVDAQSYLDYTYRFSPPPIEGWRDPEHPLFRRIRHEVGVTVLKIGGIYRQVQTPGDEDFASATETYLGGHDTVVHQATADALTAAGYGAYLVRF